VAIVRVRHETCSAARVKPINSYTATSTESS
jgi:hypothetical protein